MYPFIIEYDAPRSRRVIEQHFGFGPTPHEFFPFMGIPQVNRPPAFDRTWRHPQAPERDSKFTVKTEKDEFQVNLDVRNFSNKEVTVKTVDGFLIVEAKHEERGEAQGFVSRSFMRKYPLPEGVEADMVMATLSPDSVLRITAPLKAPPKGTNEKIVPIILTGFVKTDDEEE